MGNCFHKDLINKSISSNDTITVEAVTPIYKNKAIVIISSSDSSILDYDCVEINKIDDYIDNRIKEVSL